MNMEGENQNQDVNMESSPVDSQSNETAHDGMSAGNQVKETQQQQTSVDNTPFHEHPRFRELVEQKNEFARKATDYERQIAQLSQQMQQMQSQWGKQTAQEDPLLARLKGIDPEFGGKFAELVETKKFVQDLMQWKDNWEQTQVRQQGVNMVNNLHAENKVPKEVQDFYNAQIENMVRANPNATLKDIPAIYKQVHESFSKYMDTVKRSDREAYVSDKKKDNSAPILNKGKPAPKGKGHEYDKDPEVARAQLMKNIKSALQAEREA